MSAIVNVLGRVGAGEQNNPDDVRVVQRLMELGSRGKPFAGSIGLPQPNGHFDAVTGFWIYRSQQTLNVRVVDGIVSPARGAHYAPTGGLWTIIILNYYAKDNCPADYAALLAQSATP